MAMMDDKAFLISHIRNSFITSDDTGMCEIIIEGEEVERQPRPTTWHGNRSDNTVTTDGNLSDSGMESDTELAHSFDILPDMDFASHRRRSNTAQRLEKLKREKHKQSKIKHIQWKDVECPVDGRGELFEKKVIIPKSDKNKTRSVLAMQLEKSSAAPRNPFSDYSKFNGKASVGVATKKIDIFLTMAPPEERSYPMSVVTLATAKVYDLIGLICWQYTMEGRLPALNDSVEGHCLHIAEDDGEVDIDFPALDHREPISKFGFHKLALVERDIPTDAAKSTIVVQINMPSRGVSWIPLETDTIPMRTILEQVLVNRKLRQVRGLEYRLEKQNEPRTPLDLDLPLNAMETLEFCLVRENSVRGDEEMDTLPSSMSEMAESLSSHQYKTYIVSMLHKPLPTNTDVQLGISGEKIEIDPLSAKGKLFKHKAVTYDTESIASCSLLKERSSGRATLRLVYMAGHDYKHHDFECDTTVAREIVNKVRRILEMRLSPVHKEYVAYKEKKLNKRHTLPF